MAYWIMIFNQMSIEVVDEDKLLAAITESNYHTLCAQYKLDPALIETALMNLSVICAGGCMSPFFVVKYQPEGKRSLVVYRWAAESATGRTLLTQAKAELQNDSGEELLSQTQQIIGIELGVGQLQDMGLLFAYELARWAAFEGGGMMRGIDGMWYRMNKYKAFIPLEPE